MWNRDVEHSHLGSEELLMIEFICVIGIVTGFIIGFFTGSYLEAKAWKRESVQAGCGEYDRLTGEWKWKVKDGS